MLKQKLHLSKFLLIYYTLWNDDCTVNKLEASLLIVRRKGLVSYVYDFSAQRPLPSFRQISEGINSFQTINKSIEYKTKLTVIKALLYIHEAKKIFLGEYSPMHCNKKSLAWVKI